MMRRLACDIGSEATVARFARLYDRRKQGT
jgi:hypothetical protein